MVPGRVHLPGTPEKAASASLDKDTAAAFRARQYDKITVPKFPSAATVKNWMMSLGYNLTTAGGYVDKRELEWLHEAQEMTFEQLADGGCDRMRKCDMTLGKALIGLVNGTNEPLKNDLIVTQSKLWQDKQILSGRQVVKMILDYFKTHRDLQQKYTYEDLSAIQWKRGARTSGTRIISGIWLCEI